MFLQRGRRRLHCSFCGRSQDEIDKLSTGPGGVHICDAFVGVCEVIMHGDGPGISAAFDPAHWPKQRLIALLGPLAATAEAHRAHLRTVVTALRAQAVSWSVIADALGVSRQTAWERFH
jgi:hypothetical protein